MAKMSNADQNRLQNAASKPKPPRKPPSKPNISSYYGTNNTPSPTYTQNTVKPGNSSAPPSSAKPYSGSSSSRPSSSSSGSKRPSGSSGGSSSSAAAAANAAAAAQLAALKAQQEKMRADAERAAYTSLLRSKANPISTTGIQKNPNTGAGLGGSTGASYTFGAAMTPKPKPPIGSSTGAEYTFGAMMKPTKKPDDDPPKAPPPPAYTPITTATEEPTLMPWDEGYFFEGVREDVGDSILDAQYGATAAAVQALRDQIPLVNQGYDKAAQDAYAAYMRSRTGLPEQMAGMATGAADSLMVQNDLGYQSNLSTNELERAAALAGVQTQVAQTQAQGEMQAAQVQADLEQRAYERRLELMRLAQQQAAQRSGGDSDLTYAQALSAYNSGVRSPGVMTILTAKLGDGWQQQMEHTLSPGTDSKESIDQWIITNINNRFGNNITSSRVQDAINQAYMAGQISKDQAKAIGARYGLTL